jgi:hypothetical protein
MATATFRPTEWDVRLHAVNLAVLYYKDTVKLSTKDDEPPAEKIMPLAETIAEYLRAALPGKPDSMPRFTFLAKDFFITDALDAYFDSLRRAGLVEQAEEVRKAIQEIVDWQAANEDKVKNPDHIHVPVSK